MERGSLELGDGEPRVRIKKRTHEIGDAGETGAAGSRGTRARRPGAGEPRKPGRTDRDHVKSDVIRGPLSLGARSAPVPASLPYTRLTGLGIFAGAGWRGGPPKSGLPQWI